MMYCLRAINFGLMSCCLLIAFQGNVWAKQKENVSVSAEAINVTVDGRRRVVKEDRPGKLQYGVKMQVRRAQAGNACSKVSYLRVTLGNDPKTLDSLALKKIGSKKKGLCASINLIFLIS